MNLYTNEPDMTKSPVFLGTRLRQARLSTGASTRAVGERLGISHVTITNYESGKTTPTMEVLAQLANIYERPMTWFLTKTQALTGIRYRNMKSKVSVKELASFEASAQTWLEAYRRLDDWLAAHGGDRLRQSLKTPDRLGPSAASAAEELRCMLGLRNEDSVPSVVDVLERLGVRVIEMPTRLDIDALAALLDGEAVVVLRAGVPSDRARMNAGHELGHYLLRHCHSDSAGGDDEKRAYEFASHFLITKAILTEAFRGKSMVRLVQYKERFGISLAAMIYRAKTEGIVSEAESRFLWVEFAKRGWRRREPGSVKPDRATRFEQLLDSAVNSKGITWQEAATLTGVREEDLLQRLRLAVGAHEPPPAAQEGGQTSIFRLVK